MRTKKDTSNPVGLKFGKFTIVEDLGTKFWPSGNHQRVCRAVCECGASKVLQLGNFLAGKSKSCGCGRSESTRVLKTTHGYTSGRHAHPMYNTWSGMVQRCTNPSCKSWRFYGAKGVKVCKRWMKFSLFLKDMGEGWSKGMTIERINTKGNYCKKNCTWILKKFQANNTRRSRLIEFNGETKTLSEWIRVTGILSLRYRLNQGWSVEEAFRKKLSA